jgi:cell wall assembly regulator SMI1
MSDVLARYANWLAVQAPNTAAAARPPATDADLAEAEREIGAVLPAPIRELYRWHDGGPGNPDRALWLTHDFGFLRLETARENRRTSREVVEDAFEPDEADFYWNPYWFPIGTSWTGDFLVVDCSTSPARGRVSVACHEGPMASDPVWADLDALLGELVGALENRTPLEGYVAAAHDGWLRWDELS